jgi:hypothetical protein
MVLEIKFSDTRRKEEKRRKQIGKETEELQDSYCTREARKLYSKVKETKK